MNAWMELDDIEYNFVWDKFYEQFSFTPSINKTSWPGIAEPTPSETYSISHIFGNEKVYCDLEKDINTKMLSVFRKLIPKNDFLYALDWQHKSYTLDPHSFEIQDISEEWPVSIIPNGDYYIFLEKNFEFGVFGHPWEKTMCFFGTRLLDMIRGGDVRLLTDLIRRDGCVV